MRPNYFFAVQVSQKSELVDIIKDIQIHMCKQNSKIKQALVDPISAHMTLAVCTIHNDEELVQMERIIRELQSKLKESGLLQPMCITISGLGTFQNKVLFMKVEECDQLTQLKQIAGCISKFLQEEGMKLDPREFEAHITVAKLSKVGRKGPKKISQDLYEKFSSVDGGQVDLNEVQFCKMQGRKHGEYYEIIANIPLVAAN
eukprot:TRINITY_DN11238_c0_g1_i2.p1 TRINITY_DN11238_c0_g1~~TRINITY_DN11238_c0_g1_i2.p1  ORF type:complete len:202 (-),score=21.55 TRINITY_DN11238_c0_g1_i2:461-1066(-)